MVSKLLSNKEKDIKTNDEYGNIDRSFPPNENSFKIIKKLINE